MRRRLVLSVPILFLAAKLLAGSPPQDVRIGSDARYPVVVNGVPISAHAVPEGSSYPTFSHELAARLRLKPDFLGSLVKISVRVGPQSVPVRVGIVRWTDNGRRRVIWAEGTRPGMKDLVVGPGAIPAPRVTFTLNPSAPASKMVVLPMFRSGTLMGTVVNFGIRRIFVCFSFSRDESVVTAPAGQVLASEYGGALQGAPKSSDIAFGVTRPIRQLILERTPTIGGLPLKNVWVRTADYGNVAHIRDQAADPDEIVVTGNKQGGNAMTRVVLGRADLTGCASITFDKTAKRIVLQC